MSRILFEFADLMAPPPGWAYDSGLSAPIRTVAMSAVVGKLAPLLRPVGFLEAVVGIGFGIKGPHDEAAIDLLYNALGNRTPAIAVFPGAIHDQPAGAPARSRGLLELDVYVLSGHRRDMTDGRATTDVAAAASKVIDPGLFATLELAWMFLQDADLGTKRIPPLRRKGEEELLSDLERSCWVQRYETLVTLDVNHGRAVVERLTTLYTTLKPTGDEPDSEHVTQWSTI